FTLSHALPLRKIWLLQQSLSTVSPSELATTSRACLYLQSLLTASSRAFSRLQTLPLPLDLTIASGPCRPLPLPPYLLATCRPSRYLQTFSLPPDPSTFKNSSTASRPCCPFPTSLLAATS